MMEKSAKLVGKILGIFFFYFLTLVLPVIVLGCALYSGVSVGYSLHEIIINHP